MDSADVIQGVRQLLAAGAQFDRDRLVELAAGYMQACRQTNERVLRCRDFLCRAMREQAAEEAGVAPDLRKEIETLTFDERPAWLRLCVQVGIDIRPFDLDAELAERLAADLTTDPDALQSLLRTHRLLALGHAPLEQRLVVLRRLCKADSLRSFWKEDVRTFERRRQKELRTLSMRALVNADLGTLESIVRDLRSPEWLNPPQPRLADAIEERMRPMREAYAKQQYAYLGEQIREAHGAFDEPRCRDLVRQWHEVAELTKAAPGPELAELVAPAEEWLRGIDQEIEQEQRALERCTALQNAMEESKHWRTIEQRLDNVLRHDVAPPQELVVAAQQQIRRGRVAERNRRLLRIGGIAAAILLLVAGAAYLWYRHQAATTEAGIAGKLKAYIEQAEQTGNFGPVDAFVVHVREYRAGLLAESELIQGLIKQGDVKKAAEQGRREKVDGILVSAGESVAGATKALGAAREAILESVNDASAAEAERHLAEMEGIVPKVEPLLAEATQLAKLTEEKAKIDGVRASVEGLRRDADGIRSTVATARSTEIDRALDKVSATYGRLSTNLARAYRSGGETDVNLVRDFNNAADACLMRATELAARPDTRQRALSVKGKVEELVTKADVKRRGVEAVRAALASIRQLHTNPEALARSLEAFRKEHDDHPLASGFEVSAQLAGGWRAADAWVQLAKNWSTDARVRDSAEARSYLELLDTHLTEYPGTPYKDVIGPYQTYLQKAVATLSPDEKITGYSDTDTILNDKTIARLYTVRRADGSAFYTTEAKSKRVPAVKMYYEAFAISDAKGALKRIRVVEDDLAKPPEGEWAPAPQSEFAKAALKRLRGFDGGGWEVFYLRLSEDVQRRTDIDAILRASLLQFFLAQAANCLPMKPKGDETLRDLLRTLGRIPLDVAWYWPLSKEANQARPTAVAILNEAPPLGALIEEIEKQLDALREPLQPYRPVGLFLGEHGGLHIKEPLKGGALFVLEDNGGVFVFKRIGAVPGGEAPAINHNVARTVPAGSIVYFRPE